MDRGPDNDTAGDPDGDSRLRTIAKRVATVLAGLLVLLALVAPNELSRLTPGGFLSIPVEGLVGVALVLGLPARGRRAVVVLLGVTLGVLTIMKALDLGFSAVLARPFDPLFDWTLFGAAQEFLADSIGQVGAVASVVGITVVVIGLPILMTASILRLTRLGVQHRTATLRTAAVLGVAWVTFAAFGAQIVPGVPVAGWSVAGLAYEHAVQVSDDLRDREAFSREVAIDAFRETPGDQLLTGLRGKDVIVAFVESYGRDAVENPQLAPEVDAMLQAGNRRLKAAGFSARSAFLTSPTAGGASWLAHTTLQSGLWIDSQRRYRDLVTSDRFTLASAFHRAGWRTVGVMPANNRDWPEGRIYGYDQIYDSRNLGYLGPNFSFASIPDQYTLSAFQRFERATPGHAPVMAEICLVSSHAPWDPIPHIIDWADVGDGSGYDEATGSGDAPESVYQRDLTRVRTDYRRSIEYSLNSLISYVETYGDDLVLVLLGDHQPAPVITGAGASRDVPITVIAHDVAVLDRISGWGWQDGMKPGPHAPTWPMDAYRDRFLTAFGP